MLHGEQQIFIKITIKGNSYQDRKKKSAGHCYRPSAHCVHISVIVRRIIKNNMVSISLAFSENQISTWSEKVKVYALQYFSYKIPVDMEHLCCHAPDVAVRAGWS